MRKHSIDVRSDGLNRSARARGLGAITVATLLLLAVAAPSPLLGAGGSSKDQLDEAVRFRAMFGFDASPDTVRSLIAAGHVNERGLVLTEGEEAAWRGRAAVIDALSPAIAAIDGRGSDFAGAYVDESTGAVVLHVNVLRDTPSAAIAAFQRLVPSGASVVFHDVERSFDQLEAVRAKLEPLASLEVPFIAINVPANTVQVASAAADIAAVRAIANAHPGIVEFVDRSPSPRACSSREVCTSPWRGGTKTVNDGGFACTWGFNSRPTSGSTTRYMIEAGHCSRLNKNVTHNAQVVNVAPGVDINTFDLVGNQHVDALSLPLKTFTGARNLIFISPQSMAYAITSKKSGGSQAIGASVCFSGAASGANGGVGYKCGRILEKGVVATYSRPVDGKAQVFLSLTTASMTGKGGDSGAPVIAGTLPQAWGIYAAGDPGIMYYSPIDLVEQVLHVTVCLTSSC